MAIMTTSNIVRLIQELEHDKDKHILTEMALLLGSHYEADHLSLYDLKELSEPGRMVFNHLCELICSLGRQGLDQDTIARLIAILPETRQSARCNTPSS